MIRLKIEDIFRIPGRGHLISARGDCSKIRIGSILVYPGGREVRVEGIAAMCAGFREDFRDLLIKDEIDTKETIIYLKE